MARGISITAIAGGVFCFMALWNLLMVAYAILLRPNVNEEFSWGRVALITGGIHLLVGLICSLYTVLISPTASRSARWAGYNAVILGTSISIACFVLNARNYISMGSALETIRADIAQYEEARRQMAEADAAGDAQRKGLLAGQVDQLRRKARTTSIQVVPQTANAFDEQSEDEVFSKIIARIDLYADMRRIDRWFVLALRPSSLLLGAIIGTFLGRRFYHRRREGLRRRSEYVLLDGTKVQIESPVAGGVQRWLWRAVAMLLLANVAARCAVPFVIEGSPLWRISSWGTLAIECLTSILVARALWLNARRFNPDSAISRLKDDLRPPVLYLRSFAEDGRFAEAYVWKARLHSLWRIFETTPEVTLAKHFQKLGPFIAIGRPGEVVPPDGAARIYVAEQDWKRVVEDMIRRCAAVVFVPGQSPGLEWELRTARAVLRPDQVCFYFPEQLPPWLDLPADQTESTPTDKDSKSQRQRDMENAPFAVFRTHPDWEPVLLSKDCYELPTDHPLDPVLKRLVVEPVFAGSRIREIAVIIVGGLSLIWNALSYF